MLRAWVSIYVDVRRADVQPMAGSGVAIGSFVARGTRHLTKWLTHPQSGTKRVT